MKVGKRAGGSDALSSESLNVQAGGRSSASLSRRSLSASFPLPSTISSRTDPEGCCPQVKALGTSSRSITSHHGCVAACRRAVYQAGWRGAADAWHNSSQRWKAIM